MPPKTRSGKDTNLDVGNVHVTPSTFLSTTRNSISKTLTYRTPMANAQLNHNKNKPITKDDLDAALSTHLNNIAKLFDEKLANVLIRIDELDNNLDLLNQRVSNLENVDIVQQSSAELVNVVCSEMKDRERRLKNIIVFGLAEKANPGDDLIFVNNLISSLPEKPCAVFTRRLGKKKLANFRPLKITLDSPASVKLLFKNRKIFDDENLKISNDMTTAERNYLTQLRLTLNDRIKNGESNLTIRYVDGNPCIVTKNE